MGRLTGMLVDAHCLAVSMTAAAWILIEAKNDRQGQINIFPWTENFPISLSLAASRPYDPDPFSCEGS